ncbi:MAG TPA: hypothetical protein V6C96_02355, partial [Vampirovibrionales bacterium]
MAAKTKKNKNSIWFCKECGHESHTYLGRCPACDAWSSFTEAPKAIAESKLSISHSVSFSEEESKRTSSTLAEIEHEADQVRLKTGFSELDNVLGGGLHKGSLMLIGGDP